jgi:uncharacterized BrkB/YihY/UPF0761 family membrane protein
MKRNKILAVVFGVITVLLLCAMCATVAFSYAEMICAMNHCGASAPPEVAFIFAIPFLIGIVISAALCVLFYKRHVKTNG